MFNLRTILNYLLHLKNTAVVFLKNANETNSQEFEDYRSSFCCGPKTLNEDSFMKHY